jgi:adenylate cyclase
MERKLAAILAADVIGFSGLITRDEERTIRRLERLRLEVIDTHVKAHRGRVFKTLGDGVLAEFSSTLEAVKCALGIQRDLAARSSDTDDEPLALRIGISVGDVVLQGEDLLGDAVNVAARLEATCEPGGIAVSSDVMAQIRGKIDLRLEDCGHQRFKDTDALIHVYKTRPADRGPTQAQGLFDFDDEGSKDKAITGGCICGAIRYEINMPALGSGYCHCRICQRFSGSAMSSWTAFPGSAVQFLTGEPRYFATSPIAQRGFCPECGASLTYKLLLPRPSSYLIVFTTSLDAPQDYTPTTHGGVESQLPWIDILDDLPRTRSEDSQSLHQAWSAAGLPDPADWGPGAEPPEKF